MKSELELLEAVNFAVSDYIVGKNYKEFADQNGGIEALYRTMCDAHIAYEKTYNTLGEEEQ